MRFVDHNHLTTSPSILIRVIGVIRGRLTSVPGIREFGEPGAVQLGGDSYKRESGGNS